MAVVIETTLGDITVDLYLDQRPVSCLNFLKLCKMKFYNFNLFHTIRSGFIAQTGDPTGEGSGGQSIFGILEGPEKRFFSGEKMPKIRHTNAGLLSMVCSDDMMIGSQFFFTLASDLDSLDGVHCVIGEVTEGHEVLRKLNEVICDETHRPYQDVRITHTVILEDPFNDPAGFHTPSRSPSPSVERLKGGRIAPDEEIDETQGKTAEEIQEIIEEKEAKARATILEIVGDLPDADIAPPENVLFVCKLNPVTTDEDLEIIFSRFGKIESCEVIRDKKTGDSLQYAFIEFSDKKSCEDAYFKMDNVLIDDRRIHVDFSQSVSKMRWLGKGRGVQHFDDDGNVKGNNLVNKYNQDHDKSFKKERHSHRHRSERDRSPSNRHKSDRVNERKEKMLSRDHNSRTSEKTERQRRRSRSEENNEKKSRDHSRRTSEKTERQRRRSQSEDIDEKQPKDHSSKTSEKTTRQRRRSRSEQNNKKQSRDHSRRTSEKTERQRRRSRSEDNDEKQSKDHSSKTSEKTERQQRRSRSVENNEKHKKYVRDKQHKFRSRSKSEERQMNKNDKSRNRPKNHENNDSLFNSRQYDKSQNHRASKSDRNFSDKQRDNNSKSPTRYSKVKDFEVPVQNNDVERKHSNNNNNNKRQKSHSRNDMELKLHTKKEKSDITDGKLKSKHNKHIEPQTPSPAKERIDKKNKKPLEKNKKRVVNKKKKRRPSTSSSSSDTDSSESSSSSTDTSSSSDSDNRKKKRSRRKRKYSSSSSSESSDSTSSSSSSDSSSSTSSSSDSETDRKRAKKSKNKIIKKAKKKT